MPALKLHQLTQLYDLLKHLYSAVVSPDTTGTNAKGVTGLESLDKSN